MNLKHSAFLIVVLLIPKAFASAAISINEVAWMGTTNSQYEEWVELYNDGTDSVSIAGWKLVKSGGIALFPLTGTIEPGEYYVICRTTGTITNPLDGTCDEQGTFGGSGLNNTSDVLMLQNSDNTEIDSVDAAAGWPAGEAASKQTMQRNSSGWITAIATPGQENITTTEEDDHDDETPDDTVDDAPPPVKSHDKKEKIELIKPDPVYEAHMVIPDYGIASISFPIKAAVTKDKVFTTLGGRYEWSFGDGASFKSLKNIPIEHVYTYPGDYTITLAYYSNIFHEDPDSLHRKTITIAPHDVIIESVNNDGGLVLKNNSTKEIDLAGWGIASGDFEFIFPKYTLLSKGKTLTISPSTTHLFLNDQSRVILMNPNRLVIDRYPQAPKVLGATIIEESDMNMKEKSIPEPIIIKTPAPPAEKTLKELFGRYLWDVVFAGMIIIGVVAYLIFRLYANRNNITEDTEDVGDFL